MQTEHEFAPSSSESAIDMTMLMTRCMGNAGFADALLKELQTSGAAQVATIQRYAVDGDLHSASEGAHSVKGAASIIGANVLSQQAARTEAAGRRGDAETFEIELRKLELEMNACLQSVAEVRANLNQR